MWQGASNTLFRKLVLNSDCVYGVLSTCVKLVNAVGLMKRSILKVNRKFVMCEFIIQF